MNKILGKCLLNNIYPLTALFTIDMEYIRVEFKICFGVNSCWKREISKKYSDSLSDYVQEHYHCFYTPEPLDTLELEDVLMVNFLGKSVYITHCEYSSKVLSLMAGTKPYPIHVREDEYLIAELGECKDEYLSSYYFPRK